MCAWLWYALKHVGRISSFPMCWLPPSHTGGHRRWPDKQERSGEWPCRPRVLADTFRARTGSGNRSYGPGGNRTTPEASRRGGLGSTLLLLGSLRNLHGVRNRHVGTCSLGPRGWGWGWPWARQEWQPGKQRLLSGVCALRSLRLVVKTPLMAEEGSALPMCGFRVFQEEEEAAGVILGRIYQSRSAWSLQCVPIFPALKATALAGHMPSALRPPRTVTPVPSHFPAIAPCTYSTPVTLAAFLLQTY